MKNIEKFSPSTIEGLKHYVYILCDVVTNEVVYVGKGQNNRVFQSLVDKEKNHKGSLKAYIVRHGLETNDEAITLEATIINLLKYMSFSSLEYNEQDGVDNDEVGMASLESIEQQYSAEIIEEKDFKHDVLVISINRSMNMVEGEASSIKLYENTRKAWRLNKKKAEKVQYILAKHNGVIKAVYEAEKWEEFDEGEGKKPRWGFVGDIVKDPEVRELYIGKKISKRGYGNPINYAIGNKLTNQEGLEEDN